MTTINDIGDLARILREQPEWADAIRGVLLSKELLELPRQFARLVDLFDRMESRQEGMETRLGRMEPRQEGMETRLGRMESRQESMETRLGRMESRQEGMETRLDRVEFRLDQVEARLDRIEARLDRLEGRVGNLEGSDYERKVRYGVLHRVQDRFNLDNAYLALTQNDPRAPQLSSAIAAAIRNHAISREESEDLHNTDIIISDPDNYHVVVEASLNADQDDVARAKRRAGILGRATGHPVVPAVVTSNLTETQREQAAAEDVATFVIPYP